MSNRVNGWKINDIETHCPGVVDPWQTISKRRSTVAAAFRGAREKFIPCPGLRRWTIYNDARSWCILCRAGAVRVSRHQHLELSGLCDLVDLAVTGFADALGELQ